MCMWGKWTQYSASAILISSLLDHCHFLTTCVVTSQISFVEMCLCSLNSENTGVGWAIFLNGSLQSKLQMFTVDLVSVFSALSLRLCIYGGCCKDLAILIHVSPGNCSLERSSLSQKYPIFLEDHKVKYFRLCSSKDCFALESKLKNPEFSSLVSEESRSIFRRDNHRLVKHLTLGWIPNFHQEGRGSEEWTQAWRSKLQLLVL